tara:strand:- start:7436 stop:8590 length:1155 start_codon:yes stop_codon:yes gene_type:complete
MDNVDFLRKKLISSAKKKVQEKYEGKEVHIIKSVNLLEDLDSASNLFIEQLREWYSTHFPELNDLVKDTDSYLKLIYGTGNREKFTEKKLKEAGVEGKDLAKIMPAVKKSMGSKIDDKDLAEIKTLALNCHNLREQREHLTQYIEENMNKELPNFSGLAGPVIGAKILAKVGTKKKLAFMPASAIQVIGAEKALFLHKKKGAKSPKYGYLFQHPLIRAARYENKGKIARSLAAKLAIAIKKDYFHNTSSANEMKKELEERAEELSKRKPSNKPKPEHTEQRERKPQRRDDERSSPRRNDRRKPQRRNEERKHSYDSRPKEKPTGRKERSFLTPKPAGASKGSSEKSKTNSEKKSDKKPFGKKKAFGKPNFKKGKHNKKFGKKKN